ncbi:MAG: hypothetical protein JJE55_16025 [Flavobacteriaceae bacterium]|nr:hypothetical protein [Flavobacteriaceae bacterium]
MNLYSKNILQDIANEIKQYTNKGKTPTYIIISNADSPKLLNEMSKARLLPDNKEPKKLILYGLRVIRTSDIPEGYFDITGG